MLASLDCVSRQECWEPFLPKHLQHERSITTEKTTIEALTCEPSNKVLCSPTNKDHLRDDQWHEGVILPLSTTCCHMINKKRTRFLTPSTTSNMTIFASKDLPSVKIWWITLASCMFEISSVFLTVKKSAWVSLWQNHKCLESSYFEMTHEFWPAFMLWKHWIKTDAGSPSDQSAPISSEDKINDIHRHNLHQQAKKSPTLLIKKWRSLTEHHCSKERWIELNKESVFRYQQG